VGSVYGASVQAGAVHGDIHIHLARSTLPAPRQLPPASRRFANRHRELALLDDALAHDAGTGPTVMVLHGLAGVGKTALALTALSRWAERFPDGQMYADLTHPAKVPPADVLGQFLRALGMAADHIPAAEAERVALWRTISAQRHVAILLEAPVSAAQVRPLLPVSPHSLAVITSQRPLHGLAADGAHLIAVEPLDVNGSLELLRLHLGADHLAGHQAPAHELTRLCGGLPLALSVAAAQTAARPHRALSHTVLSLRRAHNRLELLSMHDFSTQASLDAAYRNLDEPVARAYRALGLIPGQGISCELAAAALNTDLDTAERTLGELVDTSLLTELNPSHYRFHDLVREHARHTAEDDDSPQRRADTRDRILRWYLHAARAAASTVKPARRELAYRFFSSSPPYYLPTGIDHYDTALAWLDRERRNLDAAVRDAAMNGLPTFAVLLADAMQPLAIIHKDDSHTITVDEVALNAAQDAADPTAVNTIRTRLARAYSARGDIDRAREHVDHALRDTRERSDQRGYASALKSQALLLVATGHPRAAVECFAGVVSILRDLGRHRAEGLALINLADTLLQLDRSMEAAIRLERARTLLSTLDQPDPYNAARAELSLARAHLQAGSHTVAETMATTALATMTRLSSHHQRANAHDILAELAEQAGSHQRAEEHRAAAAELRSTHTPPEPDDTTTATDPPANPG
jgi:tetratricopeptide (TPR) repeat protein